MSRRLALLSILPLLAVEPTLSNAADQPNFADQQIMQQLAEAQRLAQQAGVDMMGAIDALARAVPRYGVPYIDRYGNIVIPRLRHVPDGTPVPETPPGPL
jgi:hypothetical protein